MPFNGRPRASGRRRAQARFELENLEDRQLLAASALTGHAHAALVHAEAVAHHQAMIAAFDQKVLAHKLGLQTFRAEVQTARSLRLANRIAARANGGGTSTLLEPDIVPGAVIPIAPASPTPVSPTPAPVTPISGGGDGGVANDPVLDPEPVGFYDPARKYYTPAQVRKAYGVDLLGVANEGQGMTIGIVDAYAQTNIVSDLAHFSSQFGLPQMDGVGGDPTFTVAYEGGNQPANNTGWGLEISLDVEWAHSMAPMANIVLYEATNNNNSNLYGGDVATANMPGVVAVTNSYGGGEGSGETGSDSSFLTPGGHTPVAFFFSTGDSGANGSYPAYSPNVVAVGGTSLYTSSIAGLYGTETGWSGTAGNSGGGGGVSAYEPTPTFQSSNGVNYGHRSQPDISLIADPNTGVLVYDTDENGGGGWYSVGGTSLASPATAGIMTLADQLRLANGLPYFSSTTLNTELYGLYNSSAYSTYFHDITSGNNGYAAGTGYDLVTGIGTPKANTLIPYLGSH